MTDLIEGARGLGIELDDSQCAKLLAHLDLLDDWNTRMNLTAIRERPAQVTKHLLDSLTLLPWVRGTRVADIGSGAGFPGIPLAIAMPGVHFVLVESVGKKCRFLEHVRDTLALANVEVAQARAEAYEPPVRFDTVVARAVGPTCRPRQECRRPRRRRWSTARNERALSDGRAGQGLQRLENGRRAQAARARARRGTAPGRTRPLPPESLTDAPRLALSPGFAPFGPGS
jgi:hypothetical protein